MDWLLEIIKFVCGLLVLLILIELLDLSELIGKKIRGEVSKKEWKILKTGWESWKKIKLGWK